MESISMEQLLKEHQAIEIIKEKKINVRWLIRSKNLNDYHNGIIFTYQYLTQQEYDFLKEVFL